MEEEKEIAYEDGDDGAASDEYRAKIIKLKTELETCRKDREEYLQGWQRSKADFVNARKAAETREGEIGQVVRRELFREILEIADYFDQAFAGDVPDTPWALGVRRIHDSFRTMLARHKIEEIPADGRRFDPALHEAVQMIDTDEETNDDRVMEVFQKGYQMGNVTIRPAKVKVARYKQS